LSSAWDRSPSMRICASMLERESLFFVASPSSRLGGNQQCTLSHGCLGSVKRHRLLDIRHRLFLKCAWLRPRTYCFTWLSRLSKAAPLFGYPTPFIRFKCFALRECAGLVKRRLFSDFHRRLFECSPPRTLLSCAFSTRFVAYYASLYDSGFDKVLDCGGGVSDLL
jgi:hypothetical protein